MKDAMLLIEALKNPACYDHPVEQVETLETHISWVLLAGEFAYKIKKPVRLPFVDFSTLERRRFYCDEELRLNRRLAAELYLEVVSITGPAEAPQVNGDGPPWEYAVKMRRFSQEGLLSRVLEQGRLTPEHIDRLARQAAEFHGRIAVADASSPWGSFERIREPIEENFQELLAATPPESQIHARLLELRTWNNHQLGALHATIVARQRGGFVRECHGDMHLGNIVLLPHALLSSPTPDMRARPSAGQPAASPLDGPANPSYDDRDSVVIFDGIEFNENLRWIDVQNEIAFPLMDLDERGRPELARRLLNVYLEASGDYAGLAVLPLYLNYRALVRAKVNWIRGQQSGVAGEELRRLEIEFARYLSLAERYAQPPRPQLFLTYGVSGSGKSHFARRLAEQAGAVQIRSDVERKRLHPGLRGDDLYTAAITEETYARLEQLTRAALAAGFSVIADATFLTQARRALFQRLAERLNVPWRVLDLQASPATLRERITQRQQTGADPSDADLDVLARQLADRQPLTDDERRRVIAIDTESSAAIRTALDQASRQHRT